MKVFSLPLKLQIKDCILAVMWPKKQIHNFFKECSVPQSILRRIENWDREGLTRAGMIDRVFTDLSAAPDNGTLQFTIMLDMLSTWSYFDEYWFITQGKLDINIAKERISNLTKAREIELGRVRQTLHDRQRAAAEAEARFKSLKEMREEFSKLATESATPQARGYAFEKFLTKMARFYNLRVTESFRIRGTQIDGTFKYEGENYSLEAKWEHQMMSDEPLLAFCRKLELGMHGRGVFISINGYTPGALSILERSGIKNTVLMDGEDISLVLADLVALPAALDKKIHAAQTRGDFYVNPITGQNKIMRAA